MYFVFQKNWLTRLLLKDFQGEFQYKSTVSNQSLFFGFFRHEACVALRATGNKVPAAVRFAEVKAEKAKKMKQVEAENRSKQKRLGRTANGSWVNIGYLKTIIGFGYSEELASAALKWDLFVNAKFKTPLYKLTIFRQTDNDIDEAMRILYDDIEMLIVATSSSDDSATTSNSVEPLVSMGFDEGKAKEALEQCKGNVGKAVTKLTKDEDASQEAKRRKKEAAHRMSETLAEEEDYLSLTLQEEREIFYKYKKIMESP